MLLSALHWGASECSAAAESAAVLKSSLQRDNQQRELASSSEGEKPPGNDTCKEETFPLQMPHLFQVCSCSPGCPGQLRCSQVGVFNICADRTTLILPMEQEAFQPAVPSCTQCTGTVQRRDTCHSVHQSSSKVQPAYLNHCVNWNMYITLPFQPIFHSKV